MWGTAVEGTLPPALSSMTELVVGMHMHMGKCVCVQLLALAQ